MEHVPIDDVTGIIKMCDVNSYIYNIGFARYSYSCTSFKASLP